MVSQPLLKGCFLDFVASLGNCLTINYRILKWSTWEAIYQNNLVHIVISISYQIHWENKLFSSNNTQESSFLHVVENNSLAPLDFFPHHFVYNISMP